MCFTLDKEYLLQSNYTDNFRPNVKFPPLSTLHYLEKMEKRGR